MKNPSKYKWEYCGVIPLFSLLGVNHRQPLLHMTNKFVHINSTENVLIHFQLDICLTPH